MQSRLPYQFIVILLVLILAGCSVWNPNTGNLSATNTSSTELSSVAGPTLVTEGFTGRLIYVTDSQLCVHNLGSGETKSIEGAAKFLSSETAGAYLSMSPDQRYIAFNGIDPLYGCSTFGEGNPCTLTGPDGFFLVDSSTQEVNLIAPFAISNLSWAPETNEFVYAGVEFNQVPYRTALKITTPSGGEPFYVTSGENVDSYPSWSPTGDWIAFLREPSPPPDLPKCESESEIYNTCANPDLYIIHPDGSGLTLLVKHVREFNSIYNIPAWSPDGKKLAVITGAEAGAITIVEVPSGETTSLADVYLVDQTPAWSADGNTLLFVNQDSGKREVDLVGMDGSNRRKISKGNSSAYYPVWSPDGRSAAFVSQNSSKQRRLIIQSLESEKQIKLKDIDTPFLPLWVP